MATSFTDEQLETLRASAPISWDDAIGFGFQWNRSARSVVQKALSMNLEYIPQVRKTAPSPTRFTKDDYKNMIERAARVKLPGLEMATRTALAKLAAALTERGL